MKDSLLLGIAAGIILPLTAFLLQMYTNLQESLFVDKPIALYVIAAAINLIIVRFTYRAGKESFAKGIILITFIAMLVLIFGTKIKV